MEARYSLCPNCDACPEVLITDETVLIGEQGNQVRLTPTEWDVLVRAIKANRLPSVGIVAESPASVDCGCGCQCCGSAS